MDPHEEFLRLFLGQQSDLRAFIYSLVRDPHGREDIVQEVSLVLWRKFEEYDRSRPFGAWARGIAAHKILQGRGQALRSAIPFSPQAIQAVLDAFDQREESASPRAEALEECVAELPEKSRRLLVLRYERSLSLAEMAQQLESTLDAVHKALSRLRARLYECVQGRLAAAGEAVR